MILVTLGALLPASDVSRLPEPLGGRREMTQAIVVGTAAFATMVAAAGGVLWFTARNRRHLDG
ncbi:hypothetical protein GCM10017567_62010 [Amycolatopsis bullii]|uniref:Uncharacterized protein n=1 Tax=Amycolatopsis bullii TaxID=941987 RepID=A0ABQ3KKS9_9PSEU|nr:hypothetical protein GCM10017567_62010 [Amycolatopsis bullii]